MKTTIEASSDEIRKRFFSLKSRKDVAELLEIPLKQLTYHLFKAKLYRTFQIPKQSGGHRDISAPASALKILQAKLSRILQDIYSIKNVVHGFARDRSIVTNAKTHARSQYVLNIDPQDFFPSINFGRVRGMLMAPPYLVPAEAATVLAQLCCHDDQLPQGAPTSPVVSNMICGRLDSSLKRLAKQHRCRYTRYADDITFSTTFTTFPSDIAFTTASGVQLGNDFLQAIKANGFAVNTRKVRLQYTRQHQEVTGLTVNRFPNVKRTYIRQVRAMLHAWERYGEDLAEKEFFARFDQKHRFKSSTARFRDVLRGKIEFIASVRSKQDPLCTRLLAKYRSLAGIDEAPEIPPEQWDYDIIQRAVYVLESLSDDMHVQGTTFFLDGYGFVTCAHTIDDKTVAFHPDRPDKTYPVMIRAKDDVLDVALLDIALPHETKLVAGTSLDLNPGSKIAVYGYPEYSRANKKAHLNNGELTGRREVLGQKRLVVSAAIKSGNSGGPVLDARNRVIGVAARGANKDNEFNEAIPIESYGRCFHGSRPFEPINSLG
jgi:RNA-directed DNA polymerase